MKTNIFIPETIKVGFQKRENTYTKKLAYVIYYDQKGKLRKETSWESWRDSKIQDADYSNVPTSGFVLNKKVGDYVSDWNHRQAYVRVYDSRDFEFEITIENLLYILENTNSIKGKGLDGEFIYGWDGKELVLIPIGSPDYAEISKFNKLAHEKNYIKSKDLILGATYKTKDNSEYVYMGRFDYHTTKWNRDSGKYNDINKGKHYFFATESSYSWSKEKYLSLLILKSLGDKFIEVTSSDCSEEYARLFDNLEHKTEYSPYDKSKDEWVYYEYDSFKNKIVSGSTWGVHFHYNNSISNKIKISNYSQNIYKVSLEEKVGNYNWTQERAVYEGTLESIFEKYKPMYLIKYLANGKLHQKGE